MLVGTNASPIPSPQGGGEVFVCIDPATRHVSLDPTDPRFYEDPYAAFEEIRAVAEYAAGLR